MFILEGKDYNFKTYFHFQRVFYKIFVNVLKSDWRLNRWNLRFKFQLIQRIKLTVELFIK